MLVHGGRVEYVTDQGKYSNYWNIPIANTTTLLLGTGTSVTQAAMRELAKAGVVVGFCGGDGTPLFAAAEFCHEVEWLLPQSEYRPTDYLQKWVSFWFDENRRVEAAKYFQHARLKRLRMNWLHESAFREQGFSVDPTGLTELLQQSETNIALAKSASDILLEEARLTKNLYKIAANAVSYGGFTRSKRGEYADIANRFLDHGNYLAYGLGATASWVLGLPHGLAILHGKTRRGGLVFDIADLIKDACILPQAFLSAQFGHSESEFRRMCVQQLTGSEALDFMIDTLKETAEIYAMNGKQPAGPVSS